MSHMQDWALFLALAILIMAQKSWKNIPLVYLVLVDGLAQPVDVKESKSGTKTKT